MCRQKSKMKKLKECGEFDPKQNYRNQSLKEFPSSTCVKLNETHLIVKIKDFCRDDKVFIILNKFHSQLMQNEVGLTSGTFFSVHSGMDY